MRRKHRQKPRPVFAVVVDGETEFWYFQMLKTNERDLRVTIQPKIPHKKRLSEQFYQIKELAKDYTKVFWIIDLDVIATKAQKRQELLNYLTKLDKNFPNVVTIINNPCLEYWFLLHYEQTTKYFNRCDDTKRQLIKRLPDYNKSKKFFTQKNHDIYQTLRPLLTQALDHTQHTQRGDLRTSMAQAICEMNLFFTDPDINNILNH